MPQRHNLQGKLKRDRISGAAAEVVQEAIPPPKRSMGVKEEFVETGTGPIKMPPKGPQGADALGPPTLSQKLKAKQNVEDREGFRKYTTTQPKMKPPKR